MLQVIIFFNLLILSYAQYKDGDIRLSGGSYPWEGRVEIYLSGVWGTITDRQWTNEDAQVVCRKRGYFKPGAIPQVHAYFGEGSGAVHFDYVQCSGSEYDLRNCNKGKNVISTNHTEDVGVKCQPAPGSFRQRDIRLVGGSKNWEGRVEVYWSGTWGSVGDDTLWTIYDAQVVCRQLGYETNGTRTCCSNFGLSSGPRHISRVICQGSEININQCSLRYSWRGGPNVGVECQPGSLARSGDIRLVNGSYAWEGRVEIYLQGLWGTIYGYQDLRDARVVCRQLGYDTRYGIMDQIFYSSYFGYGTGPMHISYIRCTGSEYRLLNCGYSYGTSDHSRDWGVSCKNNVPEDGEVRLYKSTTTPSIYYGRLLVYMSDVWGKVKGSWTYANARVVCRQMGYNLTRTSTSANISPFGDTSLTTHLRGVTCQGSESRLLDCSNATGSTSSNRDVSMQCYGYGGLRDGDIRLVGGKNEREGRVEVYTLGRWGTVCDKQWTSAHTAVVCRHLGYSDQGGSYFSSAYFGQGTVISIAMDYVSCNGSERRLWDCSHFTHSYGCSHSNDVGVSCQPVQCLDGDIRLSEGDTEREGRLEVCLNQRWGTVSRSGWIVANIQVVCNQLGYPGGVQDRNTQLSFGRGGGPIYLIRVFCIGSELKVLDCAYKNATYTTYRNDVGIKCNPASCHDGELRLVEGETEWEGRLEVCLSQRWGTVSNDGWTTANTQVVCRDLGYQMNTVNASQKSSVQPATGAKPVFMEKIKCSGSELTLLDCTHNSNVQVKDHSKDVIMSCLQPTCNDGDIRLSHGDTEYDGLVEVCFNQRWGTVNGDGWSSVDAQVVCRQLGLFTEDVSFTLSGHKNRLSTPIFMDNVACSPSDSKLINCSYHRDTTEDSHSEDIIVHCAAPTVAEPFKQDSSRSFSISVASLIIALSVCILLLVVLVVFIVYRHLKKKIISSPGNNVTCTNLTDLSATKTSTMSSDQKPVPSGYQHLVLTSKPQTDSKARPYDTRPKALPKNTSTGAGVKNGKGKNSNTYAASPESIYDNVSY